ncbi:MerR family transcriptional regulator [Paractinoplanes globisporus]|uniref:MerR family transcriptional regulator n=1 Tax=Paractinoplanes globisporus TaxID=113565 RepID=A0ABW6W5W7_9ACTN|nr:MerR family transcriptional regulator [Actinoplanes globisporus]
MPYTAREAAASSGFSLDTLRYYERIGLLPPISRTPAGRRVFGEIDLKWLAMLRCLRDTGMPIGEMLRFVRLMNDGEATTAEREEVLIAHHRRVEDQIARLREHLGQIAAKIEVYRDGEPWSPPRDRDQAGTEGRPARAARTASPESSWSTMSPARNLP